MSSDGGPAYPIESVDRALAVILALQDADTLTISEIGRRLKVSRSTAYRLLSLLEYRGFVRQDPQTKAYSNGPALLRAGLLAARRSDIRQVLRPVLETISQTIDETSHLVVLQNSDAFYVDGIESTRQIRAATRVGMLIPAHVSASGKVLLANLPEDRLDDALSRLDLRPRTRRSKVSLNSIRKEIEKVRHQGYALNDGESVDGLRAVGVLVDATATGIEIDAAIGVAGPADRMSTAKLADIAAQLRNEVAELGRSRNPTPAGGAPEPTASRARAQPRPRPDPSRVPA